ncbi:MAG TPA: V-type ATPase 116kDa subunit family protein [Vicinamibacterales bacterium]|nr:V-type ATPase 116kDa subunit family protein [Vicinamibacterales bacterium]
MIVRMLRVRIAGPRARLGETLAAIQDLGVLHVDRPDVRGDPKPDSRWLRERHHFEHALQDVETVLARLQWSAMTTPDVTPVGATAVRRARRVRRRIDALSVSGAALDDERSMLLRYQEFFRAFEPLIGHELAWPDGQVFYVVLRKAAGAVLADLRQSLDAALGGEVELLHRELSSGEWAVLILASAHAAPRVSSLLSAARVDELPAPPGIGETNLMRAMPAIKQRLDEISLAHAQLDDDRLLLARVEGPWLVRFRASLHDEIARLDARARAYTPQHLFILEGWLPAPRRPDLVAHLERVLGPEIVVSTIGAENWGTDATPVALYNPPLFRPFEVITRMLPLPKYGTIDPTPLIAVFFPALFGLMLGDVGYGVILALGAWLMRVRSAPASVLRPISTVALACASSTIVFGIIFGELFGSAGRLVGLRPYFDREQATIPFLEFSIALGGAHLLLGVVLAGIGAWRRGRKREAVGRSVTFGMLVLTVFLLLAALEILPRRLFTPLAVAVLLAFIALVALEGIMAVVELLSTFGHILSYARIMAIGVASLTLAAVANKMVGALGSVLVGVVFALLFHVVNFALGLFSPAIHALRLHYVEFFGQFFSPGGTAYRPLRHWRPLPSP